MLISEQAVRELTKKSGLQDEKVKNEPAEVYCAGLFLSAQWFVVAAAVKKGVQLIVLPDKEAAEYCAADLYNLVEGDKVFFLPDSGRSLERSNYKASLSVQRTAAIGKIIDYKGDEPLFIVSYPAALEETVPTVKKLRESILSINKGAEMDFGELCTSLYENGFTKEDFVCQPGQYAVRGGIVDIFSYSYNYPFRISFFGDEVEKIHVFDTNTQLSKEEVEKAEIYPDIAADNSEDESFVTAMLPDDTVIWLNSFELYREKSFYADFSGHRIIHTDNTLSKRGDNVVKFSISPQPSFNKNFEMLTEDIRNRLEHGYRVIIFGEKENQLNRLKAILHENGGLQPEFEPGCNIHNGFIDHDDKICCYSDHEIFDRFHRVSIRRTVEKSEQLTINDLTSFSIGDYIVHIDYGVGIFGGLVKMADDKGKLHEVVKLTYKDGDVVYISVHALHKISRYKSKDSEPPKINKLGSKTWQNLKNSAKSKVKDIAKDLIQLYAKRKSSVGFAYSADTYLQQELESSFMYEDTPDQEKAINAVKLDMEDRCPMDRLVCGDVGFGKTEVAVRAAFKAAVDGKQVAVLVPTTILALQHYNTFKNRLKDFPVNIDFVSRLRTAKEVSDIQARLKSGTLEIVIGTHKILGKGFEFKDLGLLIIDEEQKFGVAAKEKLRQLKANVDTLTLTATPIPRTLQFSLLGARDLSIINTPPPNRIPIQTEIMLFDKEEIKKIINYELNRGGQLFFVHNRVEELDGIYNILHGLVPDMKICVAHGQMESKVLEDKILSFMNGDYDMLLCTTIIENGLDVPNANTIIINRAQNIGLSDLHQLRGRVGRSNKKAFCYLIVPPLTSMTDDARRRLKAIEAFSDLGSGFNIAMQDLDIRGAGNLLGAEQSGFITDMGFETYQKILAEAMEELGLETGISVKSSRSDYYVDCAIDTDQIAFIPDDYINVPAEKIRIYKDLDSVSSDKELEIMRNSITDRFGRIPEELENLMTVVKIRNRGAKLGFEKIIIKNGVMIAFFVANQLSPYYKSDIFFKVIAKINDYPKIFTFKQDNGKLRLFIKNVNSLAKACEILNLL